MGVSSAEYTLEKTMTLGDFFAFIVPKIGCFSTNVFVKPNEQNRACSSYAMARKRRMKSNSKQRRKHPKQQLPTESNKKNTK